MSEKPEEVETTDISGIRGWLRKRLFLGRTTEVENEATSPTPAAAAVQTQVFDDNRRSLQSLETIVDYVLPKGEERLDAGNEIASGGMATISAATERPLRRTVAVKRVRADLNERPRILRSFVREAQITGQLDHPNVIPVHEFSHDGNGLYFTMKLVEGRTLSDVVKELPDRPLDSAELFDLLEIVLKVCDGVGFAHHRGVIHCDIKPQNIMIADFGQVYLMDWGLARLLADPTDDIADDGIEVPNLTVSQSHAPMMGTPAFMAPEQVVGDPAKLKETTDIFALGALLYYVIARQPPYTGRTLAEVLLKVEDVRYPKLSRVCKAWHIPSEIERIVDTAMAADPAKRYQSVDALRDDLVAFARGGGEFPRLTFFPGEVIITEGETGDAAYVIESGVCEVYRMVDDRAEVVATLEPGAVFGETAILTDAVRTASIRARDDVVLRVASAEVLNAEIGGLKPWVASLVQGLAERFAERSEILARSVELDDGRLMSLVVAYMSCWGVEKDGVHSVPVSGLAGALGGRSTALDLARILPELDARLEIVRDDEKVELRTAQLAALREAFAPQ